MINKVMLIGNIGQDPEVKHLESGTTVARLSVATNESYKDKQGEWQNLTEWHSITAWRELAERVERSFKKGMMVYVEGKLTTRKWKDSEGNEKRATEIVAKVIRSLERKEAQDMAESQKEAFPPKVEPTSSGKGEDDLPF